MFDRWDALILYGLLLLVVGVYLVLSWPGLVALVGLVLIGVGWLGAGSK